MFFNRLPSITTKQLSEEKSATIIDVREPSEFKQGHIPGARNIPLGRVDTFKSTKQVYVICASGMRSKRATKIMRGNGIDAINVKGGMASYPGKVIGGK